MKRWLATILVLAFCSAAVRADVTIVQTTTIEGGMAAMAAMAGGGLTPKMTNRIKGLKSRSDVEAGPVSTSAITDLVAMQMILLRHDQKTAQITTGGSPAAATGGSPAAATTTAPAAAATVKLDVGMTPSGKSQVIDGVKCDEYTFTTTIGMAEMTGSKMPPEAAEMLKDLSIVMKGSMWVAKDVPGAAEFIAFEKAMARSDMATNAGKSLGVNVPGMDRMVKLMARLDGMAYMTVMDLAIEGGSGQMADMMRQMGPTKITTRVTSITADPLSDDLFKVPEGYTVIK